MPEWTPTSVLAKSVFAAGFSYDDKQDIIFSRMDALQRKLGYAYGYDDLAFLISAEIDCEPIFLDYRGKTWMIELWKGQYGLMTGCEIGVYNRAHESSLSPMYAFLDATVGKRPYDPDKSHNMFFDCAGNDELLEMSFTLHRRGQKLFSRGDPVPEKHWWLTGFKWGELSSPDDLSMDVLIKFPDTQMSQLFANALTALGYRPPLVQGPSVRFTFDQPRTKFQPRKDPDKRSTFDNVRTANNAIVSTYTHLYKQLGLASNDPNKITGELEGKISDYITQYGQAFFAQVVANLSKQANRAIQELLGVLSMRFTRAYDEATKAITNAGYTLSDWIGSLEERLGLRMDFSCRVQIENSGPTEHSVRTALIREDFGAHHGQYIVNPPERIAPGEIGRFWIRDLPGAVGSEGWVTYSYKPLQGDAKFTQRFEYGCPTELQRPSDNFARAQPTGYSPWVKAGDMTNWEREAKKGHPLTVAFVVGNVAKPRDK
jgi:hypothetical protein